MVQILSMMEQEVVGGEQEIHTQKEMLKALKTRTELQEKTASVWDWRAQSPASAGARVYRKSKSIV